jgi:hypothetical protein
MASIPAARTRAGSPGSRRAALLCGAAAACLLVGAAAGATLYKWTDADGRVVYSDQPPMGNAKVEIVTGAPPPADPGAARDLAAKEAERKKRQLERTEEAQKAEQARTDAATRQTACVQGRGRLRTLQEENLTIYRVNERGERVYMDGADRRKEIEQQEKWLRENCAN